MTRAAASRAALPAVAALAALAFTSSGWSGGSPVAAEQEARAEPSGALRRELTRRLAATPRGLLKGEGTWLFLREEANVLLADRFWGADAGAASLIQDPAARDPLPQVLAFRDQLAARGIELLFVPIPAKLAIYPERLLGPDAAGHRLDGSVEMFLRLLEGEGVRTLDLVPEFLAAKNAASDPLYLATDSHWSPRGIQVAAGAMARRLRGAYSGLGIAPDLAAPPSLLSETVDWGGDLTRQTRNRAEERERVALLRPAGDDGKAILDGADRDSPILLLGDSYLLVYEVEGSSFRPHLESLLGRSLDQVAVYAGGPTGARQALARRDQGLRGKRLVVWLSAARLFVAGPGWLPVTLPPDSAAPQAVKG